MPEKTNSWVRIALFNLFLVAILGAIMRYKIGYALPWFDQKYLQEAHSHFAFAGWITHTLYVLLIRVFRSGLPRINEVVYRRLIMANLFSAYGMLLSFPFQGYGPVSLAFSTLSVLTGYAFSWYALKDTGRLAADHPGKNWIKVAIWFGLLSTVGTMVLSWMMASHHYNQNIYLGSIYFYLHFQYNGWFLFACIGIFMDWIRTFNPDLRKIRLSFMLFALAGIPAYFLSTLWANLPAWLYALVVAAASAQVIGWYILVTVLRKNMANLKTAFNRVVLILFLIVALALTLKLFLQIGSTIPGISKLAFGFRPIVIAYLHLVLLLIISVFLLAFMTGTGLIRTNKLARYALIAFTGGAILNESVLAVQGIFSFSYTVVPLANEALFGIAVLLVSAAVLLFYSQSRVADK